MQQAHDYRTDADNLFGALKDLGPDDLNRVTQFKGWTIQDVIGHLHFFDTAAIFSLKSADAFDAFFAPAARLLEQGHSFLEIQQSFLQNLSGRELIKKWHETSITLTNAFRIADPKARLKWAGPDMSARSAITARQMETWAHGQEIYDILGQTQVEGDHIRNICHLGVSTCSWTHSNRGLEVPTPAPFVQLTAPSGDIWEWNADNNDAKIVG